MGSAQVSVGGGGGDDEVYRLLGCEPYRLFSIFQSTGQNLPEYFNLQINPTCTVTLVYGLTASCVAHQCCGLAFFVRITVNGMIDIRVTRRKYSFPHYCTSLVEHCVDFRYTPHLHYLYDTVRCKQLNCLDAIQSFW